MSPTPDAPESAAGRERGHGIVARLFHWVTAMLVLGTIPVGIAMVSEGFEGIGDALYIVHKNVGVIVMAILVLRLLWKLATPAPPALPESVPPLQRRLAESTHLFLYVLLGIMTATGYLRVVSGDFPIELLDALGVPPLLSGQPDLSRTLSVIHKFTAYVLVATLAVHTAAAAHHALILRDGVFSRMWPPWRRDAGTGTP
jgi:cytochrome b561